MFLLFKTVQSLHMDTGVEEMTFKVLFVRKVNC